MDKQLDMTMLPVGTVLKFGDLYQTEDGRYLEIGRDGKVLGVIVHGSELKKTGLWFRPIQK